MLFSVLLLFPGLYCFCFFACILVKYHVHIFLIIFSNAIFNNNSERVTICCSPVFTQDFSNSMLSTVITLLRAKINNLVTIYTTLPVFWVYTRPL